MHSVVFSSMYLCIYMATYLHTVYVDWQLAVIVSDLRCACSRRSSELRDTLRGCDRASLEMHLDAVSVRMWRPWLGEFRDTLEGCDRASFEIHLEAVIARTWRPWLYEFWDTLEGCNRATLEMHLEGVIERVWRYALGGHHHAEL